MNIVYLLNISKDIWGILFAFWLTSAAFLAGTKYGVKNNKKKQKESEYDNDIEEKHNIKKQTSLLILLIIIIALTLVLVISFGFAFYPPNFKIYNEKVSERSCIFEIPSELIGRLLVPVYIKNNTKGTQIVNITCVGEEWPVIPIYYEDAEGSSIRETRLVEGNNGPFLISTDMLYGRDEYFIDFIIEPHDKSIGKISQKIKLRNQPWKHFTRVFDNNWVNVGDKFKVEVQITNFGISSNFYINWEIYKITTNPNEYPWNWRDGKSFIDVGRIERDEIKTVFIGNKVNGEDNYFQINEPGLYHIKTYTYKDFHPQLVFNEENFERTMEILRKYHKKRIRDEKAIELWQASDLHQMNLVYVLPKE